MILCLWSPLHPLSKLLAIQDHTQNLEEQLWMGGRREVSIIFYRPVTRRDLKQERSFCRGSVSSFLQLVVATYCHCCLWSHITCLWLTVCMWRMIIALLCLDICFKKHEKYSAKAVSINKLKLQGLIREAPSNQLLNKANKVNEEERFAESTMKEALELYKNIIKIYDWVGSAHTVD